MSERTDLYGVAATLYFAMTGEDPPDYEARYSDIYDGCEDPLHIEINKFQWMNENLKKMIMNAMELDFEKRISSMFEFIEGLKRCIDDVDLFETSKGDGFYKFGQQDIKLTIDSDSITLT